MTIPDNTKVAVIFGTDTGNTELVGEKICNELSSKGIHTDMFCITEASQEVFECFDFLILGIPTWDFGGIQQDWEAFEDQLSRCDLTDKTVALYGLGDQFGYADYFLDAMGWLYERVLQTNAQVIGFWSAQNYEFSASLAATEDKSTFCGLAIDEDQQFELTDDRVKLWSEQIIFEFNQLKAA